MSPRRRLRVKARGSRLWELRLIARCSRTATKYRSTPRFVPSPPRKARPAQAWTAWAAWVGWVVARHPQAEVSAVAALQVEWPAAGSRGLAALWAGRAASPVAPPARVAR